MKNLLLLVFAVFLTHTVSAQCNASFTYSTSNLTGYFTNTSTAGSLPPTYYATKSIKYSLSGSFVGFYGLTSHTFPSPGTYTVVVRIVVTDSINNVVTCTDYDTQSVTVNYAPCSVSISQIGSGSSVTLTANNLASTPGMSYSWNFGDGNTGTGSPVTHTYTSSGFYHITLTASSSSANCSVTDSTGVSITVQSNVISGWVIGDSTNSNDTFKVWLIKFDSSTNNLYAVDSLIAPATWGYASYAFHNKAAGQYRTKAAQWNGPTSGTGYLPTYHTSSLYWSSANVINHGGGTTGGNYIIMQVGTVTGGPGFVGGNVTMGANKGTSGAVEGMLIFLRDASDQVLQFAYTDAAGNFAFNNVPLGSFSVYPEEGGYATTPASLVLTQMIPGQGSVNFERHDVSKTVTPKETGIDEIAKNKAFSIYPNPASSNVHISMGGTNKKVLVSINDITGRNVWKQNISLKAGQADINLSQLQSGPYFISIENDGKSGTEKLLLNK